MSLALFSLREPIREATLLSAASMIELCCIQGVRDKVKSIRSMIVAYFFDFGFQEQKQTENSRQTLRVFTIVFGKK